MSNAPYPLTGPDMDRLADGSPRPRDPLTGKPLMTEQEANWHGHTAGMHHRATEETGGDPRAKAALLDGAAAAECPVKVGGHVLESLTVGTFQVLQMIDSAHARENPEGTPLAVTLMDMARTALVFARPSWSYQRLKRPDSRCEFDDAAMELSFELDAPKIRRINAFIQEEMAAFFGEDTTAKKPDSPRPPAAEPESSPDSSSSAAAPSPDGSAP